MKWHLGLVHTRYVPDTFKKNTGKYVQWIPCFKMALVHTAFLTIQWWSWVAGGHHGLWSRASAQAPLDTVHPHGIYYTNWHTATAIRVIEPTCRSKMTPAGRQVVKGSAFISILYGVHVWSTQLWVVLLKALWSDMIRVLNGEKYFYICSFIFFLGNLDLRSDMEINVLSSPLSRFFFYHKQTETCFADLPVSLEAQSLIDERWWNICKTDSYYVFRRKRAGWSRDGSNFHHCVFCVV